MVKKLLNPLAVFVFIAILLLGSMIHLMYGSCQTSNYHYMCQEFWMHQYLPRWTWASRKLIDTYSDHFLGTVEIDENFTGVWEQCFENGNKHFKGRFVNGIKDGHFKLWYFNGNLKSTGEWVAGKRQNVLKQWFENGDLEFVGNYKNGLHEGRFEHWYRTGTQRALCFSKNGVFDGIVNSWYENGAPSKAWCFLLGVSPDLEILPSSEELIRASHSPVPSVALI